MIDVPVRVKDALRSGDYKKEYKIDVLYRSLTYTRLYFAYSYLDIDLDSKNFSFKDFPVGSRVKISLSKPCTYGTLEFARGDRSRIRSFTPTITDNETYVEFNMTEAIRTETRYICCYDVSGSSDYDVWLAHPFNFQFTLSNSDLVAESVKLDERMCSDSDMKFGLCEGSSFEFQYFNYPNIRESHINSFINVQYKSEEGLLAWHEIPIGQYDVVECSRQASTGIIKAIAYNRIRSDYLDMDVRPQVEQIIKTGEGGLTNQASIYTILRSLLDGFSIPHTDFMEVDGHLVVDASPFHGDIQYLRYYDESPYEPYDPSGDQESFYVWYFTVQYRPTSATTYETDGYYKYSINTPLVWDAFKNELTKVYYGDGSSRLIGDVTPGESHPGDFIRRSNPNTGTYDYNLFKNLAETAFNNPTYDDPAYEGSVVSSGGLNKIISANRNASIETSTLTTSYLRFSIPFFISEVPESYFDDPIHAEMKPAWIASRTECFNRVLSNLGSIKVATIYKLNSTNIENRRITLSEFEQITGPITLRNLQTSVFEIDCQFGKLDRVTNLFSGVELNNNALYPVDTLYPAEDLYPMGAVEGGYPSMYNKLWADEENVHSFKGLTLYFKNTNGDETKWGGSTGVDGGTDEYYMTDNWLLKNLKWTQEDIFDLGGSMLSKLANIRWFPFEMWCAGLPYLETGDEIEIQMKEGTYKSYVLRRTMSGIQNLQDEMINGTLDIF